jgi:hypothetical protein
MVDVQQTRRPELSRRHDEHGAVLLLALLFVFVVSLVVAAVTSWEGNDLKNAATFASERGALYGAGGATQTAIAIVAATPPTETTSQLTSGTSYSSLNVTALPEAIPSGTTIVIGTIPTTTTQSLTVSSAASAGATVINVSPFIASATQPGGTLVNLGLCPGGSGGTITVWCSTVLFPQLTPPDPSITREVTFSACPSTESQSNCMMNPYLNAVVDYDDYNTSNQLQCTALPPSATSASCGTGITLRIWAVSGR